MAVHQAAMRRTGQHVLGVDTHSMGTFTGIARSLMETGENREDKKPHETATSSLPQHVYMGTDKQIYIQNPTHAPKVSIQIYIQVHPHRSVLRLKLYLES